MVTAGHRFVFRLNEKKKILHAVIKTHVFDRIYTLLHRPSSKALRNYTHSVQINCFVLKKGPYVVTKDSVAGASVSVTQRESKKDNKTADCRKKGGEKLFT